MIVLGKPPECRGFAITIWKRGRPSADRTNKLRV